MEFDRFLESFAIWNVRRNFNGARYSFYKELAAAMRSGGSLLPLIKEYSVANEKTIAPMMKNWLLGFEAHPDSFGDATKAYVDKGDSVVLSAVEKSGSEGYNLLSTYALNLKQRKTMMSAFLGPLFMPAIALVVIGGVTAIFGIKVFPQMVKKIPLDKWSSQAQLGVKFTDLFLSGYGVALGVFIVCLCVFVGWSLNNYVGRGRDYLDRHVFPYPLFGQMEILSALTVLAALVSSGRQDVEALEIVMNNSSKWMKYQLEKIKTLTKSGHTVFGSLDVLPIAPLMAARIRVAAKNTKLNGGDGSTNESDLLPALIVDACFDEGGNMVERMGLTSKISQTIVTFVIASLIMMFVASIFGFTQAASNTSSVVRTGSR